MNNNQVKTTLLIGGSENPERYSNMAMNLLKSHGHPVFALGNKEGSAYGIPIRKSKDVSDLPAIDTVTLYLNPFHQKEYYDTLLALKPGRVIFNPGTENPELQAMLDEKNIDWEEACTLILLRSGQY